jgi:uncharacterized protein YdaU (DUF1376 family)
MSNGTDMSITLVIGDYLADTARLTTEGHGACLLLLMDTWRNGPPPDDDETLAAITRLTRKQRDRAAFPLRTAENRRPAPTVRSARHESDVQAGKIGQHRSAERQPPEFKGTDTDRCQRYRAMGSRRWAGRACAIPGLPVREWDERGTGRG